MKSRCQFVKEQRRILTSDHSNHFNFLNTPDVSIAFGVPMRRSAPSSTEDTNNFPVIFEDSTC